MKSSSWLVLAMVAAIASVAALLQLDVAREFEVALDNLAEEQVALATAVAADFETRLNQPGRPQVRDVESSIRELLGGAIKLQQPGSRVLLIARPDEQRLLATDGRDVASPELVAAVRTGRHRLVIPREQAPDFGLPARIALAGIDAVEGPSGKWGVIVLVTAQRLRARERYAQLRFLLSLGLVTSIVLGFGLMVMRQQKRKMEVARALEIAALERDRERLLAKADKMATLAALSSGIAHEVATPLGTIMARIEQVLPANEHDPRASAALRIALEQVSRIQTVIRGVLGLARGEMPPLVRERPEPIVHGAVALTMHRFEQAGVAIELELRHPLPEIACDPPMIEQALTNLLLNACDASERGSIVRLSVRSESSALVFLVEDEGEGISAETAARAHEPFFTTKPRGSGNGLGLAIAREVVAHHGGKLQIGARVARRGTQAVVELPLS